MRAAAIFGLGSSPRNLKPFQDHSKIDWSVGLPATSDDIAAILIFGGDGTVHRHLKQLVTLHRPVLVVPCGSGNDFARALGLRRLQDSLVQWKQFVATNENVQTIDLGTITPLGPGAATHYFCCVAGCGLDSAATRRANAMPSWLRSHGGYALGLAAALAGFRPLQMKVRNLATEAHGSSTYKPIMLAAFANASTYGHGMCIAPRADMHDGELDVCLLNRLSKLRLTYLFPTVYSGKHLKVREVEYFRAERLRLDTDPPADLYADGEFVCRTPVELGVAPAVLPVIAQPKAEP
jgi:diacylglycerol kinase (ATP)